MAAPMKIVLQPESGSYMTSLSQDAPNMHTPQIFAGSTVRFEPKRRTDLEGDAVRSILAERALKAFEVAKTEAAMNGMHCEQVSSAQMIRHWNSETASRPHQRIAPSAPDVNQACILNRLEKLAAQQKSRTQVVQPIKGGFMQHFSDADAMMSEVGCASEPNYFSSAEHAMLKERALKALGSAKSQAPMQHSDSKLRVQAPTLNVDRDYLLEALDKIASRKSAVYKSHREAGLLAGHFAHEYSSAADQTMLAGCNEKAPPGLSLGQEPTYAMSQAPTQAISHDWLASAQKTANYGILDTKWTRPASAAPSTSDANPPYLLNAMQSILPQKAAAPLAKQACSQDVATSDLISAPMFQSNEEEDAQSSTNCDECDETDSTEAGSNAEHASIMINPRPQLMTTLMIRNVPVMYTQDLLLIEWPNNGTYDFLYLPYTCALKRNLSYAFINFTSEEAAHTFTERWEKKRLNHFTARKPLNISSADVQGRDSNLIQLRKKGVGRIKVSQYQPMIFENGQHVPLTMALAHLRGITRFQF